VERTTRTWRARPRRPQYGNAQIRKKSTLQRESAGAPPSVCAALPSVGPSNIRTASSTSDPTGLLSATLHHDGPTKPPSSSSTASATAPAAPKRSLTGNNRHRLPLNTISLTRRTCLALPQASRQEKPFQAGGPGGTLRTKGPSKKAERRAIC